MFLLLVMVLCFAIILVVFIFYSTCFSMHLVIKGHHLVTWHPHVCCLIYAYYITFHWNHVVHPRFMPLYLHKYAYKLAWKFWWNLSPTSFTIVGVQVVVNSTIARFSIALWIPQFVAVPKFTTLNHLSSFFFHLLDFISFTITLSMVLSLGYLNIQHVIKNNQVMAFSPLFVLKVNEAMKASCASIWILGSNLEAKFFATLREYSHLWLQHWFLIWLVINHYRALKHTITIFGDLMFHLESMFGLKIYIT